MYIFTTNSIGFLVNDDNNDNNNALKGGGSSAMTAKREMVPLGLIFVDKTPKIPKTNGTKDGKRNGTKKDKPNEKIGVLDDKIWNKMIRRSKHK